MDRVSIKEAYSRAGANILTGNYPVSTGELPSLARYTPAGTVCESREVMREKFPLPREYEHLAWWTYQAFLSTATEARGVAIDAYKDNKFLRPAGAETSGIFEMAQYLAIITDVYYGQTEQMPDEAADRLQDVRAIAMRSGETLRTIADEPMPVAGKLEENNQLSRFEKFTRQRFEEHNYHFVLDEGEDRPYVRTKFSLDNQITAITKWYERDMEEAGETPARRIGCFAMKMDAVHGISVFDAIWHGIVLAGTTEPIVGEHLKKLDAMKSEY